MKLELSTWSIVRAVLVLLGFWLLFEIRNILVLLFIVLILVAALGPTVNVLESRKVPRLASVFLVVLAVLLFLALLVALVVPTLVSQLQAFGVQHFPDLLSRLAPLASAIDPTLSQGQEILASLIKQLQLVSGNVFSAIVTIFGGLLSTLTVIILTFYLLAEKHHHLEEAILKLLPEAQRKQVAASLARIGSKLGSWLRGQFILSLIVGILAGVATSLIGIVAPVAIGVLAGLLEIVPIIGPLVTGVVMVVMSLVSGGAILLKVLLVLVFFTVLQLLEGQILVPKIMQKAVGLSPVLVIVALLIGSQLAGITGAILAVPLAAILQVVVEDWPKLALKRQQEL